MCASPFLVDTVSFCGLLEACKKTGDREQIRKRKKNKIGFHMKIDAENRFFLRLRDCYGFERKAVLPALPSDHPNNWFSRSFTLYAKDSAI
jgi:hypothetical protein